jgi:threonylcarbamoyladenosine tRNA methylthiotransferase MtaB
MNFTIKTIGCKVNTYESTKIKDELIKLGFNYIDVEDKESYKDLDFYIVNTCSVTSIADKKSRQMLHLAKKYNPNVRVIAIGCMVDSLNVGENAYRRGEFNEPSLAGVDYLIPNYKKDTLSDFLLSLSNAVGANANVVEANANTVGDDILSSHVDANSRIRAFIKIQDGCNQYCTYCIIPYLRGNIKSRDNDDIVKEVREKVKSGVKEIVLTGIHLSSFGLDRFGKSYESEGAIEIARNSLLEIMNQIAEIEGIERIRLGSLEPRIIDVNFLSQLAEDTASPLAKKFCANFCLSLQSGCDKTLKRMNRHYTTADYEKACDLIRKYLPNATITTDVIVGFPGETEEDFVESLEFVKKMRFYNPNIFPYSIRQGTKAAEMDNQLSNAEKHRRAKIMIEECEKISKEIQEEYNKTEHEVLIEEKVVEDGIEYGIGYTMEYIKKKVKICT